MLIFNISKNACNFLSDMCKMNKIYGLMPQIFEKKAYSKHQ